MIHQHRWGLAENFRENFWTPTNQLRKGESSPVPWVSNVLIQNEVCSVASTGQAQESDESRPHAGVLY